MRICDPLEQAEFICNIGQRIRNYFWGNISRKMGICKKTYLVIHKAEVCST